MEKSVEELIETFDDRFEDGVVQLTITFQTEDSNLRSDGRLQTVEKLIEETVHVFLRGLRSSRDLLQSIADLIGIRIELRSQPSKTFLSLSI